MNQKSKITIFSWAENLNPVAKEFVEKYQDKIGQLYDSNRDLYDAVLQSIMFIDKKQKESAEEVLPKVKETEPKIKVAAPEVKAAMPVASAVTKSGEPELPTTITNSPFFTLNETSCNACTLVAPSP